MKAIFCDRDGTINKKPAEHDYVKTLSEFKKRVFPTLQEDIGRIKSKNYKVIVITNQAGINKGVIKREEYKKINNLLKEFGIDGVYTCQHNYLIETCKCRKPSPKMILQAAKEYGIDLKNSWMIGDGDKDVQAGREAGCKTFKGTLNEFAKTI